MDFQWDNKKAETNIAIHGIDFADAVAVFEDLNALTIDDPHPYEQRVLSIGLDFLSRVLVGFLYMERQQYPYYISKEGNKKRTPSI